MHVQNQTKDKVAVIMSPHEAQRLLAGLREHHDVLGPVAAEIEQALDALGIAPDHGSQRIVYEHAPLKD